jgi:hypothetical protein
MNSINQPQTGMQLYDAEGRRLYFTEDERRAFLAAAATPTAVVQHRASGLNLLVTAIILWNTRYLNRAIAALRAVEDVPDHLLAHLSPLWLGARQSDGRLCLVSRPEDGKR